MGLNRNENNSKQLSETANVDTRGVDDVIEELKPFIRPASNIHTGKKQLKSREELLCFGFRDLAADALTEEEIIQLNKSHEAVIASFGVAEKKLEELSELHDSLPFLRKFGFNHCVIKYPDGAEEVMEGLIMKNFYHDLTGKNQITDITISISDQRIHPESPTLLINVVLRDQKQAERFNELFQLEKLAMLPSGTNACGFSGYDSLEFAFQKFVENKIISQTNANILLSEVKLFMEGRHLIDKHVLISYIDNASFSLYTTTLSREGEKRLNNKNWIGFNSDGEEQYYPNSYGVRHILIQNCTQNEFLAATTAHPIEFRLVKESELTVRTDLISNPCKLKLNVRQILSRDTHTLKATSGTENKKIHEEKLKHSVSALVSMVANKSKEHHEPDTTLSQSHLTQSKI